MARPIRDLETVLRQADTLTAAEIAQSLDVSQPSVSRLIKAAGSRIIRIGRARATRYALAHEIGRAGHQWPLYRINPAGRALRLGEVRALHSGRFHLEPERALPAFLHGAFSTGLFPGLPWFLDDQRPQGFLGRAFVRKFADDIGAPADLARWRSDDVVLGLLRHGEDAPGDLVLGEQSVQRALQSILKPDELLSPDERPLRYPRFADAAMRGDVFGSSAGGEQPKFTVTLRSADGCTPVVVKFSERVTAPAGRRWADLLVCEHLASESMLDHALPAAQSELIEAEGRVFLQSLRFDRTPVLGRAGYVSLDALDAAFYGHGNVEWWRFARELSRDGWLSVADATTLSRIAWFGALIANTDMHLGNAALRLVDARPLPLAPAYDMLPMAYRPATSGEVVTRDYVVEAPPPEYRDDWHAAAIVADNFWHRVADEARLSPDFRAIAQIALFELARAVARA